jgi:hypothetical protein
MWTKLEVYNGDQWIGSFYTNKGQKDFIQEINDEFGVGKWTRYNIGN